MTSYFASAGRASEEQLAAEIAAISGSPVMTGLLCTVGGLLAVLDEHRQILALNAAFLQLIGVEDPAQTLGLRLGEVLGCVHAEEEEGGCGTSRSCSTCGAAIAMVASLGQDAPVERFCAVTVERQGQTVDIALSVRSHPVQVSGRRFLLVFLQDVTEQQRRAALERTFFHDVNNTLSMLVGASSMLSQDAPSPLADAVHRASVRLAQEVAIQHRLAEGADGQYQPTWQTISTGTIYEDLQVYFSGHPAAVNRRLDFAAAGKGLAFTTDRSLLLRILCNMVINALEASAAGGKVRVWIEREDRDVVFCVWNAQAIPEAIARRIFQRNFSTKDESGRGVGTYAMKLFGEEVLGGRVWFTSSSAAGTVFRLALKMARKVA